MMFLAHVMCTNKLQCFMKLYALQEVIPLLISHHEGYFMISKFDFGDFRQGIQDLTKCQISRRDLAKEINH